jgi:hypothetical protein
MCPLRVAGTSASEQHEGEIVLCVGEPRRRAHRLLELDRYGEVPLRVVIAAHRGGEDAERPCRGAEDRLDRCVGVETPVRKEQRVEPVGCVAVVEQGTWACQQADREEPLGVEVLAGEVA